MPPAATHDGEAPSAEDADDQPATRREDQVLRPLAASRDNRRLPRAVTREAEAAMCAELGYLYKPPKGRGRQWRQRSLRVIGRMREARAQHEPPRLNQEHFDRNLSRQMAPLTNNTTLRGSGTGCG